MGDLVNINGHRDERIKEQRENIVRGLEDLLGRARAGQIVGVCFAAVPADRQSLIIGGYKSDDCGAHELVGVSTLLARYITDAVG